MASNEKKDIRLSEEPGILSVLITRTFKGSKSGVRLVLFVRMENHPKKITRHIPFFFNPNSGLFLTILPSMEE